LVSTSREAVPVGSWIVLGAFVLLLGGLRYAGHRLGFRPAGTVQQPVAHLGEPEKETVASPVFDPFAMTTALALNGPGAADAVRALVLSILTDQAAEIIITRSDAWDLLGVDAGDLIEDRIPGLVLVDDSSQARDYLETTGPRRLYVTRGGLDLVCDLVDPGRIAVISLTPCNSDSAEVKEYGQVIRPSSPELDGAIPSLLPPASRQDAHGRLMALPTIGGRHPRTVP
jgi:hypothetical protein